MAETTLARRPVFRHLMSWPFTEEIFPALFGHELRVEEKVDGDNYIVRIEAPGIDVDKDATIEITDHTLAITIERHEEQKEEGKGFYRSEFSYGSFRREIALPEGTGTEDVKATYTDGILEVRMPIGKAIPASRTIPVTTL